MALLRPYVDFEDASCKEIINAWVRKNTKGEIERLIGEEETIDDLCFMLLDALYFKGRWSDVFEKENTTSKTFFNHGKHPVNVPTMNANMLVGVGMDEKHTSMSMDFGNRSFSMNFIMANDGYDIDDVIEDLDIERWQSIKEDMRKKTLDVSLPKFRVAGEIILDTVMKKLGLTVDSPDLSLMSDEVVHRLKIRQNTVVEVEERGTVASSVTDISGGDIAYLPSSGSIHIDRPFVFLIEEHSTGAILFMGKIAEL